MDKFFERAANPAFRDKIVKWVLAAAFLSNGVFLISMYFLTR